MYRDRDTVYIVHMLLLLLSRAGDVRRRRGAGMEREGDYEQQPGEVELVGWLTFTAPSLLGAPPAAADASACESMRRVLMSL